MLVKGNYFAQLSQFDPRTPTTQTNKLDMPTFSKGLLLSRFSRLILNEEHVLKLSLNVPILGFLYKETLYKIGTDFFEMEICKI